MKTNKVSFNTLYLPVKNGLAGQVLSEIHKERESTINFINVIFHPDKPIGKWVITAAYYNKGIFKALRYGKTQKEIRCLVKDINDFHYDPILFLTL
jgi:hypothetical protein